MNGFSTVDGFVEITESFGEMIKYVANEPSVGLFYVQQHAQNAVPNLVALNNNVTEKSRITTLHAQDLDDSVTVVRSMKEHGLPIAGDMIKDIKSSLLLMSSKQPQTPSSGLMTGRRGSWGPSAWGQTAVNVSHDNEKSSSYLSTVFKSAKQKASKLKWPQLDSIEAVQKTNGRPLPRPPDLAEAIEPWQRKEEMPFFSPPLTETVAAAAVSPEVEVEFEELPPSSEILDAQQEHIPYDGIAWKCKVSPELENYDVFRANKEAKLKMWLEGTGNVDCKKANVIEEP